MRLLCCLAIFTLFITTANGNGKGELSESVSLLGFIRSVDPANHLKFKALTSNPCLWKGIKCLSNSNSIAQVTLDNMNLSGIIDADSLCNLPNLRVLNLANNHIKGNIPAAVSGCANLRYLNLSNNLLNGSVPLALYKLKNLKTVDISNNQLTYLDLASAPTPSGGYGDGAKRATHHASLWSELVLLIVLLAMLAFVVNVRITKSFKEKKKLMNRVNYSSPKVEVKQEQDGRHPELVFFVEEKEQFKLENLLDAGADMQNQNYCSSLYKVQLKNDDAAGYALAVKRLKKLQATCDEFERTMAMVGRLNHPNILPLVAYSCQGEEKLLIYKYQNKGSLLSLMESYVEGKRDFPWKLRLSVAIGIARGLDHIYRSSNKEMIIPHGNIKPSNILLNENEEALISEYGYSKLVDRSCGGNGYTAPEKCLSEQGDVFSFGVILLELLTGKIVENSSGLDLPKWVKAMVREEWTGEVFDKEIAKVGMYAFPLLNVSLKCVAHFPENRPAMAEVLEKIMRVIDEQVEDISFSYSSMDSSSPQDGHVLYSVAEETPGHGGS